MKEIIDRIKAAEKAAEVRKAAAEKEADRMISGARDAGRTLVENAIAAASEEAGKITAKAETYSSAQAAGKIADAKQEAAKIMKNAGTGFDAAVDKVMERVVSDI